jgi:hypothetical protein
MESEGIARDREDPIDYVISQYDKLAESFRDEADRRVELNPQDPLVNSFRRCAVDIENLGTALHEKLDLITTEEYAELNRVSVQTVRRWCRLGEIEHFPDARGILIPRHAQRNRYSRTD